MDIQAEYISSGCNRCPKSCDWGGNENQLAYAFSNSIAILSGKEPFQIKINLNQHTNQVNCLKWVSNLNDTSFEFNELISGSVDRTLIVWRGKNLEYEPIDTLSGHTDSVFVCDAIYEQESTLICSSSADSTVKLWFREKLNKKFECLQTLVSKSKGFALALKFFKMPILNAPGLLIGYENHKIELYTRLLDSNQFNHLHTLLGHDDWIRDIDVCSPKQNQLLITSCSQDTYIRIWKLEAFETKKEVNGTIEGSYSKKLALNVTNDDEEEEEKVRANEITLKSTSFNVNLSSNHQAKFELNLESVLYGHEDWIYSVRWAPKTLNGEQPLTLVSSSIDKTIVLWKYDETNSLWLDTVRIGDIGGNNLGFYGGLFSPNGDYIVAHGFQGALYLWKRKFDGSRSETLVPAVITGGHFDIVEDLCWDKTHNYILSVSKDQTTRFHGYWKNAHVWCEMGRPQIHGYDLKCIASIQNNKFVSGADEKILRVFSAPRVFLENYYKLSQDSNIVELIRSANLPQGASVPALGLSNKAVFDISKGSLQKEESVRIAEELYKELQFSVVELNSPPSEEHLLQNTLWPEIQKLYGHGFELFSCAVHPNGNLIASACKATKAKYAEIILWKLEDQSYKQMATLAGHELTIVQMAFSNNGEYLLSVSRDRSWCLFKKQEESYTLYKQISTNNPVHTRIVWSCSWSFDDKHFITTSRDKKLAIWSIEGEQALASYEGIDAITACSIGPSFINKTSYLIAIGYDNGKIELLEWSSDSKKVNKIGEILGKIGHHKTISRLAFRQTNETNVYQLASSSHDHSCFPSTPYSVDYLNETLKIIHISNIKIN